jgi:Transposase, Mutator family
MTETLVGVSPPKENRKAVSPAEQELAAAREMVKSARARGVALTGPDGLLKAITKTVLESALEEEMSEHVGYDKHAVQGRNAGNSRNGTRSKTVLTEAAGEVSVDVPRDRAGTFDPVVVKKRQRRLSDVDAVAISLYAKGFPTGEISAHFAEVYGASVSKDTVSRITDRVIEDMQAWSARPLLPIYAAVFIDAIYVKVRDGQVGNQPFYAAIGVDLGGHRDVLGLWAGRGGGESAKLVERFDRPAQPGCAGRVLHCLRRPKGTARLRQRRLSPGDRAGVRDPPDPSHPAVRLPQVLGPAGEGPQGHLYRPHRAGGVDGVRGARGEVGQPVPGDPQTVAGGVGRVHPILGLRSLCEIACQSGVSGRVRRG